MYRYKSFQQTFIDHKFEMIMHCTAGFIRTLQALNIARHCEHFTPRRKIYLQIRNFIDKPFIRETRLLSSDIYAFCTTQ